MVFGLEFANHRGMSPVVSCATAYLPVYQPNPESLMSLRFLPLAATLTALPPFAVVATTTLAAAGFCGDGRAVECYQKTTTPDVYKTVQRPVVIAPGHTEVVREPAVTATHTERVVTSPGRWVAEHVPAQYGTVERTVMVRPASVAYVAVPAQYRTVRQQIVVQPASYRWERRSDWRGNETMCKILVPAISRSVERTMQVAPAERVAQAIPATYHTVRQTVLAIPATVRHSYVPPTYDTLERTVVVRPAAERVVQHAPVIGVAEEQVLVQHGTTQWQPARLHWFH